MHNLVTLDLRDNHFDDDLVLQVIIPLHNLKSLNLAGSFTDIVALPDRDELPYTYEGLCLTYQRLMEMKW